MKNIKTAFFVLFAMTLIVTSCFFAGKPEGKNIDQVETMVVATLQSLTESAPKGILVSFNNVSFTIPDGLAGGAEPEIVPVIGEDGSPWDMGPEHVLFTITGYPVMNENEVIKPTIYVYPAQSFADLNPGAGISLPKLKSALAAPSAPINIDSAPAVPFFNAAQILVSNGDILNFKNGMGVRMISHYAQFPGPIIVNGQLYHYQGLTSDGRYYIIAIFPVISPLKSTANDPSADGITYPEMGVADEPEFESYYQSMTDILNAADPNSFQPPLAQLDALIASIQLTP